MPSEKASFARFGEQNNFSSAERVGSLGQAKVGTYHGEAATSSNSSSGAMVRALDWIIMAVLVLFFFGIPLFFTGVTFQGVAFEKEIFFYLLLLIGLVAWASKGVLTGEMEIRRTPLDIPLLAFLAFYGLTVVFSVDRWHSFWGFFGDPSRGFISITAFLLAYYFILSHFSEKRFHTIIWSLLASGGVVTVWSFLVIMRIHFMPASFENYAPISLMGTLSSLTLYLSFLIPIFITGIFMLWREGNSIQKTKRTVLTALLGVTLLLDLFLLLTLYPFVSWAVVLGGLGFFLIYILAQIVRPKGEWAWIPMVVFIVVLSFLMIGNNKLARANLPIEVTPNARLSWEVAKQTVKEHFLTGSGAATYGYDFSLYRPQEFNGNALYTLRFYQGTGLFFEALPTIGVIGTVLMLVIWFSFLSIGLYLLTLDKTKNKIFSLGFWSTSVMLFIAGFVTPINAPILILGVLLSTVALGTVLWESESEEHYLRLSFKATPKFALALAFIFMVVSAGVAFLFVFIGKTFVADVYAGIASKEQPSQEMTIPRFARAMTLYPEEGRYFTRYAQENMALANAEGNKNASDRDVNKIASLVREAVSGGERSKQIMPNDVLTVEALGLIYENASLFASDALPKSEEMYLRAQELEPQNPLYAIKLGQMRRVQGDAKPEGAERTALMTEAKNYFQNAIDLKPNLAVAYYNLAVALARLKDMGQAITETQKALQIDPNNLAYQYNLGALYQLRHGDGDYDRAEGLYKQVLDKNERLIDVRLSLGLLYESEKKTDMALTEYQKILTFLPESGIATDALKQTRDQVNKLIDNVKSGKGNLAQANPTPAPVPTTANTATPSNTQGESLLNQPPAPTPQPAPSP